MAFALTTTQRDELEILRDSFPAVNDPSYSISLHYYEMYELVLSYIEAYEVNNTLTQDEEITKIWLEGVIGVNRDDTLQSDFIRDYNSAQKELRYGQALTSVELDKASDQIALLVIDRILSPSQIGLPAIDGLAGIDVATVSEEYLNNDASAWAGNPLLLFLGYAAPFNDNIIGDGSDSYDLLAMMQATHEVTSGALSFTGFFDPSNWALFYQAMSTAAEAEAIATVDAAYDAADNLLESMYGVDLFSTTAYEVLFGDIVLGSEGDDSAVGGSNLEFLGYSFNEIIHAGAGNDTLIGGYGADILDGGAGIDTVTFADFGEAVAINLTEGVTVVDNEIKDRLYHIENVIGSAFNDILFGNGDANQLQGGNGDDSIFGGEGSDEMHGGGGIDTLSYAGATSAIAIMMTDSVSGSGSLGEANGDTFDGFEAYIGSNYNDHFDMEAAASVSVNGGGGDDILIASGTESTLTGGALTDGFVFKDHAGADSVITDFNLAYDYIDLRHITSITQFSDITMLDNGGSTTLNFAGQSLILEGISSADISEENVLFNRVGVENTIIGYYFRERIVGTEQNDAIYGLGNYRWSSMGSVPSSITAVSDQIYGYGGNDVIFGGFGGDLIHGGEDSDSLYGGVGDDQIYGGMDNDVIFSGEGNDQLIGGTGNDTLTGGSGADMFGFDNFIGRQDAVITDFNSAEDRLYFPTSRIASLSDLHIERTGGDLIIYMNSVQSVRLIGMESLTLSTDFIQGIGGSSLIVNGTNNADIMNGTSALALLNNHRNII